MNSSLLKHFIYIIISFSTFMAYSNETEALSSCFRVSDTEKPIVDPAFDKEFMQSCFIAQSSEGTEQTLDINTEKIASMIPAGASGLEALMYTIVGILSAIVDNERAKMQENAMQIINSEVGEERFQEFIERGLSIQNLANTKDRNKQLQALFIEYQDVTEFLLKQQLEKQNKASTLGEDVNKQVVIDHFLSKQPQENIPPEWTEFLQLYIHHRSFRQIFHRIQNFSDLALSTNIPIEDTIISLQSLLPEATISTTWDDKFLTAYIEDSSFKEWTHTFQSFLSHYKYTASSFSEQELLESQVLDKIDSQVIIEAFKDDLQLSFLEKLFFWDDSVDELLELYTNHLAFRQDVYKLQIALELSEDYTISSEDIEILSSQKWKEYFREHGQELFDINSNTNQKLIYFQSFLYDYHHDSHM